MSETNLEALRRYIDHQAKSAGWFGPKEEMEADRLWSEFAGIPLPQPKPGRISLEEAKSTKRCRICGEKPAAPFIYNFGREHAHEKCLGRDEAGA